MPVRVSRASSVIVHRVPAAAADRFLALQDGFARAAEAFPGYQGTDVYPPAGPASAEWVVLVHFADEAALRAWLGSPVRAEWVGRVRAEVGDFRLATGFGSWFTGPAAAPPPGWKMVLTVLLGLYPTVVLLSLTLGRATAPLGMAAGLLIGNAASVSLLQWVLMPALTRALGPWLHAGGPGRRAKSLAGAVVIVVLLAGMAALFRRLAEGPPG